MAGNAFTRLDYTMAHRVPIATCNGLSRQPCKPANITSSRTAKTCSTAERTFERAALARLCGAGIGLPLGFLKWIIDLSLARRTARSFLVEHILKGAAIVACGMGDGPLTDKAFSATFWMRVRVASFRNVPERSVVASHKMLPTGP